MFITHIFSIIQLVKYFILLQAIHLGVSVFYEGLCVDSRIFIRQQLYPAFEALKGSFEIILVPYGRSSVSITIFTFFSNDS